MSQFHEYIYTLKGVYPWFKYGHPEPQGQVYLKPNYWYKKKSKNKNKKSHHYVLCKPSGLVAFE